MLFCPEKEFPFESYEDSYKSVELSIDNTDQTEEKNAEKDYGIIAISKEVENDKTNENKERKNLTRLNSINKDNVSQLKEMMVKRIKNGSQNETNFSANKTADLHSSMFKNKNRESYIFRR